MTDNYIKVDNMDIFISGSNSWAELCKASCIAERDHEDMKHFCYLPTGHKGNHVNRHGEMWNENSVPDSGREDNG